MATRTRQFISVALLMCFLAPLGLSYAMLKLKQWKLREDIEHQILLGVDKGELIQLTFTAEQAATLKWEHEREFEYQGQSYDVVEKEEFDGKIIYHVWWDKAETKIKYQLDRLVAMAMKHDPDQQHNQVQIERFLKGLYHSVIVSDLPIGFGFHIHEAMQAPVFYRSICWSPPVPPPIYC
ncbi:hypothetical protein [Roseivirga thermotolerans]|uniref:hypothetical protein n=1 Tax=Roseivirga thermotolerans TaxID=1758176 RepID=UPI00273FDF37|nr:hypothetical protein [Roseivirga thermotolerans]